MGELVDPDNFENYSFKKDVGSIPTTVVKI
jgi:hypothetical protein